jgi:hypothetical protein
MPASKIARQLAKNIESLGLQNDLFFGDSVTITLAGFGRDQAVAFFRSQNMQYSVSQTDSFVFFTGSNGLQFIVQKYSGFAEDLSEPVEQIPANLEDFACLCEVADFLLLVPGASLVSYNFNIHTRRDLSALQLFELLVGINANIELKKADNTRWMKIDDITFFPTVND